MKDALGERSIWYLSCIELWIDYKTKVWRSIEVSALPDSDDKDEQVLNYLEAVNLQFVDAFNPGDTICLDESIVKSFHHDLKGKMKII